MAITDVDEWLQPDPGTRPWVDGLAFTAWDDATDAVVTVWAEVRPDDAVTATWVSWVGGAAATSLGRVDWPPRSNWDRMQVGPVGLRMIEARRRWALVLDDPAGAGRAYLELAATTPCVPCTGGYAQGGRLVGDLVVGGRTVAFDGVAHRDHRCGPPPVERLVAVVGGRHLDLAGGAGVTFDIGGGGGTDLGGPPAGLAVEPAGDETAGATATGGALGRGGRRRSAADLACIGFGSLISCGC